MIRNTENPALSKVLQPKRTSFLWGNSGSRPFRHTHIEGCSKREHFFRVISFLIILQKKLPTTQNVHSIHEICFLFIIYAYLYVYILYLVFCEQEYKRYTVCICFIYSWLHCFSITCFICMYV